MEGLSPCQVEQQPWEPSGVPGLRDVNKDMSGFLMLCLTTPLSLFLWFCIAFSRLNKMNSLFLPCNFNTFPVAESILCIYSGFRDASAETFNQILLGLGFRVGN